jgi:flagellin-like protein
MKTFRKFRKSVKALSPVVASIILIAVTVAVSIAVAAWMGALSVGFMQTEQLTITKVEWTGTGTTITLTVRNSGTTDVIVTSATVNSVDAAVTGSPQTITKNTEDAVELTAAWSSGDSYQIRLFSQKGTTFVYNAVASP